MSQLNEPKVKKMQHLLKENISLQNNEAKSFERNVKSIFNQNTKEKGPDCNKKNSTTNVNSKSMLKAHYLLAVLNWYIILSV